MRFNVFMILFCAVVFSINIGAEAKPRLCSPYCRWTYNRLKDCAYVSNSECNSGKAFVIVTYKPNCFNGVFTDGGGEEVNSACIKNKEGMKVCGNAETLLTEIKAKNLIQKCVQKIHQSTV